MWKGRSVTATTKMRLFEAVLYDTKLWTYEKQGGEKCVWGGLFAFRARRTECFNSRRTENKKQAVYLTRTLDFFGDIERQGDEMTTRRGCLYQETFREVDLVTDRRSDCPNRGSKKRVPAFITI